MTCTERRAQIQLLQQISSADEDLEVLNEEMDSLVKERDQKDQQLKLLQLNHQRVLNLRNKCIQRN